MNGLPYYKRNPRQFVEGTVGMTLEVKGAYAVLLDLIYMQDGNLRDDPRYIAGLLGCSVRKWKSIRKTLLDAGKIYVKGVFISNFRADKELEETRKFQEKMAENRAGCNKNNGLEKQLSNHIIAQQQKEKTNVFSRRAGARKKSGFVKPRNAADAAVSFIEELEHDQGREGENCEGIGRNVQLLSAVGGRRA